LLETHVNWKGGEGRSKGGDKNFTTCGFRNNIVTWGGKGKKKKDLPGQVRQRKAGRKNQP